MGDDQKDDARATPTDDEGDAHVATAEGYIEDAGHGHDSERVKLTEEDVCVQGLVFSVHN